MSLQKKTMKKYKSLDSYEFIGGGTVFVVENEIERPRFNNDLLNSLAEIDGTQYIIRGVESFLTPKILKGDKIGLLVKKI